jgi:hypothetical protein
MKGLNQISICIYLIKNNNLNIFLQMYINLAEPYT